MNSTAALSAAPHLAASVSGSSASASVVGAVANSPKRKRATDDVSDHSRSPLRLRTDLPSRPSGVGGERQQQQQQHDAGSSGRHAIRRPPPPSAERDQKGESSGSSTISPRSKVSNQLQDLHLQQQQQQQQYSGHAVPQLSFRSKLTSTGTGMGTGLAYGDGDRDSVGGLGGAIGQIALNPAATPPRLLLESSIDHQLLHSNQTQSIGALEPEPRRAAAASGYLLPSAPYLEGGTDPALQPKAPHLRPQSSPQTAPRTISPLPSATAFHRPADNPFSNSTLSHHVSPPPTSHLQPQPQSQSHLGLPQEDSLSPQHTLSTSTATSITMEMTDPTVPSSSFHPAPQRLKSPPLSQNHLAGSSSPSSSPSSLVWTPGEITGHDPTDPADDGYGINGIGFRPTAAMAQARALRRKQQVADWKSREAKEARLKRAERRRGGVGGGGGGGGVGGASGSGSGSGSGRGRGRGGGKVEGGESGENGDAEGVQAANQQERRVRFV